MNTQIHAILRWSLASALLLFGLCGQVEAAACPNGENECETIFVYRVQSVLPLLAGVDAAGRSFLSLTEANANDEKAFLSFLQSATANPSLAIRTQVTRITDNPNNYCNCNLEENGNGSGCHGGTPMPTLQLCSRVCRYQGVAADCKATGSVTKANQGNWYAFPAATQCGVGPRVHWKKHPFGNLIPTNCDWNEGASVVKAASCIADQIVNVKPTPTLAHLYGPGSPCPNMNW
ncbi:MAG: hypothetical protein E5Y79_13045 [Mesorhizobium sp.]|uniref:hypothetical protein n=1 Tax=Mesorhizobium sp. TaxID=1871066 RepID=UPI0012117D39|nr:hypothetical protein [Mesorhizobium sp.]TIL59661.1 MAG: hypothetical protein E5Y79_13045 [Mesorhizobium sp.]